MSNHTPSTEERVDEIFNTFEPYRLNYFGSMSTYKVTKVQIDRVKEVVQALLTSTAKASEEAVIAKIRPLLVDEDPDAMHPSHYVHEVGCIPQLNMWARDSLRTELRKALNIDQEGEDE